MARRTLLINLILFLGVVGAAYLLVAEWREFEATRNLERILAEAERQPPALPEPVQVAAERLRHDFWAIGERNLFDPDRGRTAGQESVVEEKPPEFPKDPVLQGITESEEGLRAYVIVYDNPRSEGQLRTLAEGDTLQGYTVERITDTEVVLRWNDVTKVIDLFSGEATPTPRGGQGKQVAAVNIIRIGSGQAAVETSSPEALQGAGPEGETAVGSSPSRPGRTLMRSGGVRVPGRTTVPRAEQPAPGPPGMVVAPQTGLVGVPGSRPPQPQPQPE
ncbi:MAG: hypothetical protein Kow00109_11060 [Acidobacteriota bacterium]